MTVGVKTLLCAVALSTGLALAGCSKGSDSGAAEAGEPASAPVAANGGGASGGKAQKPGQWTVVMKIYMTGIPADQMKMMEDAGMGGMFKGEPNTLKQCVTAERSARGMFFETADGPSCEYSNKVAAPGSIEADMTCPGPDLKGSGHLKITAASDKAFSGGWTLNGVDAAGNKVRQEVQVTGTWDKDSCDADAKP